MQDLLRIISKAMEECNLEWSPPTEPVWNRLDEWYLQPSRCHESSPQTPALFFPKVHNVASKMWHAPYSARAHIFSSALLTVVDGVNLHGYSKLSQIEEAIAAQLCPSALPKVKSATVHPIKSPATPQLISLGKRMWQQTRQLHPSIQ